MFHFTTVCVRGWDRGVCVRGWGGGCWADEIRMCVRGGGMSVRGQIKVHMCEGVGFQKMDVL